MSKKSRKLGILHISSHFYPRVDGTVRSIDILIRGLQQRGHAVSLITRQMSNTSRVENHFGVTIFRVPSFGRSLFNRFLLGMNQTFFGFLLMRRKRIDIIDTHGFSSMIAGFLLKKIFHVPLVLTFHGFPRLWMKSFGWRKWHEQFLSYPMEKFLIKRADKIIVRSSIFAKMAIAMYGSGISESIEVVPHAVNTRLFTYKQPKITNGAIVLSVGALSKVYGFDLLIKAIPIVLRKLPETKFIIVGEGPLRHQLENLAKELSVEKSVTFTGLIKDQKNLVEYYHLANVVVFPLKYKGYILSIAAVEALATGRPIITTMHLDPALKDVGVFLVKESNADELAKTIISVLSDKNQERISISARKYAEKFHSMDRYLPHIEKMYLQLIKASFKN